MQRSVFPAVILAVSFSTSAWAQSLAPDADVTPNERPILVAAQTPQARSGMGGGFIEFLFGGGAGEPRYAEPQPNRAYANAPAAMPQAEQYGDGQMDPRYERQEVEYRGKEAPGTIVIDTPNKFLYLVEARRQGDALRRRRRSPGFHLGGRAHDLGQEGMAGLDAAGGNARAPARPAAFHGRRPGQSARRARDVSRLDALPHPRLERALDHRPQRLVRLHPPAQRRCDRSLRAA